MDSFDDGPLLSNSRILRLTAYSLVAYSRALHLRQFRAPRVPEPVLASAQADGALAGVLATLEWLCGACMGR